MRSVGRSLTNNKFVAQKIITVSALLLFSACSPLSNRLVEPASSGGVYPLTDTIVTNSISSRPIANTSTSRRVVSRTLAPIEDYSPVETVEAPYRKPRNGVVVVRSGDTLLGVAREHDVDAVDLAELNQLDAPYALKIGDELVLPGTATARKISSKRKTLSRRSVKNTAAPKIRKTRTVAIPAVKPKKKLSKLNQPIKATKPKNKKVAKVVIPRKKVAIKSSTKKVERKSVKIASVEKSLVKKKPALKRTSTKQLTSLGNKFRWPVRGRVISEFGSKSNGAKNDGINLSVPKGAAIVAAENGVVVYSGNELKGYGNLVLIRHQDGWSTAYAHTSQMLVKKGQKVRRGQVIAKAGQTGSVTRPQLHFELRRGTNPVDPRKYLSGAKVAFR